MYFNQEFVVARRVLELANTLINNRNRHIRDLHITTDQADALIYYHDFPDQTISDLKNFQHIRHQSAQVITQKLVDKGLVTLIKNPNDRRAKLVVLTDAGNMMRLHLKNNGSRTGEQLLNGFSDNEKQQFLTLLEKSISNLNRGNK
ncbi:MarR family transcriptional regulator [Secundilactobacillus pentosiphilus]|uniref:MarR family transcriptional regulator n=1 Tax=Secundilactobacillus pentosiphilus TaxID=1714682 RepID=A0A1Z5IXQ4_9LACO|nr:MarR family winged helix-turn-helix transcriptional regulator [Secundilactobacillus pentosiphilus]GAX06348.1 MarR family transcriptional regulator [Secundilactobacillus pentosiphilus]